MPISFRRLHPLFAAEVSGVDLRQPLDAATVKAIDAAMDEHAVLVFRDQPLSQGEQVAFAKQFGPLDAGLRKATGAGTRFQYDELIDISNLSLDGNIAERDSAKLVGTIANQLWHSDSSFQTINVKYSMLSAVVPAAWGGDTEFADLRAAYDALDDATKAEIEPLVATHSAFHSRRLLGDDKYTAEQLATFPPVPRRLVQTHRGSGRKLLFVGVHCNAIEGMSVPEARMLIADLLEHATDRRFVYRHKWRPNDLLMWDNRATLHRGRRYDLTRTRDLRRTTTIDVDAPPIVPASVHNPEKAGATA